MKETVTETKGPFGIPLVEVSEVPETIMHDGLEWEATTYLEELKSTRTGLCYTLWLQHFRKFSNPLLPRITFHSP